MKADSKVLSYPHPQPNRPDISTFCPFQWQTPNCRWRGRAASPCASVSWMSSVSVIFSFCVYFSAAPNTERYRYGVSVFASSGISTSSCKYPPCVRTSESVAKAVLSSSAPSNTVGYFFESQRRLVVPDTCAFRDHFTERVFETIGPLFLWLIAANFHGLKFENFLNATDGFFEL